MYFPSSARFVQGTCHGTTLAQTPICANAKAPKGLCHGTNAAQTPTFYVISTASKRREKQPRSAAVFCGNKNDTTNNES